MSVKVYPGTNQDATAPFYHNKCRFCGAETWSVLSKHNKECGKCGGTIWSRPAHIENGWGLESTSVNM